MRGATHTITIKNMSPSFANQTFEDEGIWSNTGASASVVGSVHQKISEDISESTTGQMTEQRNVICRLPLSADVTYGDQIIISGIHAVLNGTYEIDALLYTRTHIRADCRRTLR